MGLNNAILRAVKIIEGVADPRKILLFGSAARGENGENSDIDLLIVVKNGTHRRNTARRIYRALLGIGFAIDIVVVTEDDLERYAETPGMIIASAIEEGREIYAA